MSQTDAPVESGEGPLDDSDEMASFKQKLEKLKLMKEAEIISDAEFDEEKKKLLNSL